MSNFKAKKWRALRYNRLGKNLFTMRSNISIKTFILSFDDHIIVTLPQSKQIKDKVNQYIV